MDIDHAIQEFKDFYFRCMENGFPIGTMSRVKTTGILLARACDQDVDALMLEVRRDAVMRLALQKRLSNRSA